MQRREGRCAPRAQELAEEAAPATELVAPTELEPEEVSGCNRSMSSRMSSCNKPHRVETGPQHKGQVKGLFFSWHSVSHIWMHW